MTVNHFGKKCWCLRGYPQSALSPECFKFSLLLRPMVRALTLFRSPVLTNFPLEPQQDVRVSKISSLTPSQHPSPPKAVGVTACVRLHPTSIPKGSSIHQSSCAQVHTHVGAGLCLPGRQQPHLSCSLVLCPSLHLCPHLVFRWPWAFWSDFFPTVALVTLNNSSELGFFLLLLIVTLKGRTVAQFSLGPEFLACI